MRFNPCTVEIPVRVVRANRSVEVSEYSKIHFGLVFANSLKFNSPKKLINCSPPQGGMMAFIVGSCQSDMKSLARSEALALTVFLSPRRHRPSRKRYPLCSRFVRARSKRPECLGSTPLDGTVTPICEFFIGPGLSDPIPIHDSKVPELLSSV